MTRPRYTKSSCCVPFCRRTSTLFPTEWVCGEHWRLVDRSLKAFRTQRLRAISRLAQKLQGSVAEAQAALAAGGPEEAVWAAIDKASNARRRWRRVERATWAKMKRQAIERAAGAPI